MERDDSLDLCAFQGWMSALGHFDKKTCCCNRFQEYHRLWHVSDAVSWLNSSSSWLSTTRFDSLRSSDGHPWIWLSWGFWLKNTEDDIISVLWSLSRWTARRHSTISSTVVLVRVIMNNMIENWQRRNPCGQNVASVSHWVMTNVSINLVRSHFSCYPFVNYSKRVDHCRTGDFPRHALTNVMSSVSSAVRVFLPVKITDCFRRCARDSCDWDGVRISCKVWPSEVQLVSRVDRSFLGTPIPDSQVLMWHDTDIVTLELLGSTSQNTTEWCSKPTATSAPKLL